MTPAGALATWPAPRIMIAVSPRPLPATMPSAPTEATSALLLE